VALQLFPQIIVLRNDIIADLENIGLVSLKFVSNMLLNGVISTSALIGRHLASVVGQCYSISAGAGGYFR
jgi:hypothetical protein